MSVDRMHNTLQENLLCLLAYDDQQGRIVSNMLETQLMEGDYRLIADRCIDYWHEYKQPPSEHVADLFADIIEDKHNRRAKSVTRVLTMMSQLSESINTEYVMNQLRLFQRMQRIKGAIITSADKITSQQQLAIGEIEDLWHNILRTQERDFEPGMYLSDYGRVVDRLEKQQAEFSMGIDVLDKRNIQPIRGALMILLAAAGRGKTWGLVHIGKTALAERKKVLHLTGEMDVEYVAQRYYQAIFGVSKRAGDIEITTVQETAGRIEGLERVAGHPDFSWDSDIIRDELASHIVHVGPQRFNNLLIKRFKPNQLTANGLRAYLDTLEITEKFIPDMIILDYAALMKLDPKNLRVSLGQTVVELRAIAIERNVAMITAHQGSKEGERATMMDATHIAEDWSIVGTADFIISYSCTKMEFQYGLGRLFVAKARSDEDRFAVLITQSYKMGQFCLESHLLDIRYFDYLKELAESEGDAVESNDDDD